LWRGGVDVPGFFTVRNLLFFKRARLPFQPWIELPMEGPRNVHVQNTTGLLQQLGAVAPTASKNSRH
jgi:hypothetical protein